MKMKKVYDTDKKFWKFLVFFSELTPADASPLRCLVGCDNKVCFFVWVIMMYVVCLVG